MQLNLFLQRGHVFSFWVRGAYFGPLADAVGTEEMSAVVELSLESNLLQTDWALSLGLLVSSLHLNFIIFDNQILSRSITTLSVFLLIYGCFSWSILAFSGDWRISVVIFRARFGRQCHWLRCWNDYIFVWFFSDIPVVLYSICRVHWQLI